MRCGGIVLAVIEIIEFVAHMSGSSLIVQLTVEPARATLWYCDALAVIIVDLCVTIPCGIGDVSCTRDSVDLLQIGQHTILPT